MAYLKLPRSRFVFGLDISIFRSVTQIRSICADDVTDGFAHIADE